MTQQEILEYNKKCAEFLGAIYSDAAEAWGFGNAKNIGSKMFHGVMYHNVIQAERFEKELKFHSDWNWIMEVIEAIEELGFVVKIKGSPTTSKRWHIHTIGIIPDTWQALEHDEYAVHLHSDYPNNESKKEAVVRAINQFLIWYEQNKTT